MKEASGERRRKMMMMSKVMMRGVRREARREARREDTGDRWLPFGIWKELGGGGVAAVVRQGGGAGCRGGGGGTACRNPIHDAACSNASLQHSNLANLLCLPVLPERVLNAATRRQRAQVGG